MSLPHRAVIMHDKCLAEYLPIAIISKKMIKMKISVDDHLPCLLKDKQEMIPASKELVSEGDLTVHKAKQREGKPLRKIASSSKCRVPALPFINTLGEILKKSGNIALKWDFSHIISTVPFNTQVNISTWNLVDHKCKNYRFRDSYLNSFTPFVRIRNEAILPENQRIK